MALTQKRMLLICPEFHGYDKEIQKAFERKNFSVDLILYNEHYLIRYHPFRFPLVLLATVLEKIIGNKNSTIEFTNRLKEWAKNPKPFHSRMYSLLAQRKQKYDWCLIVKGYGWNRALVKILRSKISGPIALYQWDPATRFPSLFKVYPLLDSVFVFQSQDSTRLPNTTYLPTFYLPKYSISRQNELKMKITFVGYFSHVRYKILKRLAGYCYQNNILADFILVARFPIPHYCKYSTLKIRRGFISRREVEAIYSESTAIVDIPKPGQDGLTQRVYEAISAGRKIITHADNFKKWPLYSPDWILSVSQFIHTGRWWLSVEPKSNIDVTKYSIDNWAARIWQHTKRASND